MQKRRKEEDKFEQFGTRKKNKNLKYQIFLDFHNYKQYIYENIFTSPNEKN